MIEWNKLDRSVCKCKFYSVFENTLLKLGGPNQCAICSISNPVGLKLLTYLRLGLSHLNEHRLNYNFQNCISPSFSCSLEIESGSCFLLHRHHYKNICLTLLNSIAEIKDNSFKITH